MAGSGAAASGTRIVTVLSAGWATALERMFRRRQNRLYMPTVLLAVVHLIDTGKVTDREVLFADVEPVFNQLGGSALSGRAWQPFFHLSRSAGIWEMYQGQVKASFADLSDNRPKSVGALTSRADRARLKDAYLPGLLDPVHRRAIAWEILQRLQEDDTPLPRHLSRLEGIPIGRPYEHRPPPQFAAQSYTRTYTTSPFQRASNQHAALQGRLARLLQSHRLQPLEPMSSDPAFDLAWASDSRLHIAEVKSLTAGNESEQLRRGLGQVLEYRHLLAPRTAARPQAVLLVERKPERAHWPGVCRDVGVELLWPDIIGRVVNSNQRG